MKHSKLLEIAQAHYKGMERNRIEIPEWLDEDGNPSVIHSKPLTLADMDALAIYKDKMEYNARLLVRKATDADGNPSFEEADVLPMTLGTSATVVSRLAGAIALYTGPKAADLKN